MTKRGIRLVLMASLLAMLPSASLAAKTDSCPSEAWGIGVGGTLLGMDRVGDRPIDPEGFYCFKVVPGAAHDDVVVVGPRIVFTED